MLQYTDVNLNKEKLVIQATLYTHISFRHMRGLGIDFPEILRREARTGLKKGEDSGWFSLDMAKHGYGKFAVEWKSHPQWWSDHPKWHEAPFCLGLGLPMI